MDSSNLDRTALIVTIGSVIGVVVLVINPNNQVGFSLASAAIAGAVGLTQPQKNQKEDKRHNFQLP